MFPLKRKSFNHKEHKGNNTKYSKNVDAFLCALCVMLCELCG